VPTFAGIEDASEYRCFIALFPAIINHRGSQRQHREPQSILFFSVQKSSGEKPLQD